MICVKIDNLKTLNKKIQFATQNGNKILLVLHVPKCFLHFVKSNTTVDCSTRRWYHSDGEYLQASLECPFAQVFNVNTLHLFTPLFHKDH